MRGDDHHLLKGATRSLQQASRGHRKATGGRRDDLIEVINPRMGAKEMISRADPTFYNAGASKPESTIIQVSHPSNGKVCQ